jgi:hypothetical protein
MDSLFQNSVLFLYGNVFRDISHSSVEKTWIWLWCNFMDNSNRYIYAHLGWNLKFHHHVDASYRQSYAIQY